jgi:hypothetical protein
MKSTLFEHYKKKYALGGKKVPVRKTGMWYQDGDVVVPSNEITMKGPDGEKDYFDSPIMGIGLQSGESQVMLPGEDYFFPEDEAVYETKMQAGGKKASKEMTPEQQARFDAYMKSSLSRGIQTPEWLELSSGATNFARRFNRMSQEELMSMPGDISGRVSNAFNQGIDYSIDYNVPRNLGQFSTEGNYNPLGQNTLQDMYSGLTYRKSFPKGSIRVSPTEQQAELRGKLGKVKYKREMSDDEVISNLAFDVNVFPEALNLYGEGSISDLETNILNPGSRKIGLKDIKTDPQYSVRGGIRGDIGPFNYSLQGNYNPDTGYRYSGDAELSLLKNRLNLSGNVAGSQEEGLESLSAEARARLLKGLNVKAGYRKYGDQPGTFNVGLSYNKFFEEGGEVEDIQDEREDDKEMVEGIADILRRVKDKNNRKQIAKKMVEDFEEEEVQYNLEDFMQAAKLMQMGGMSIPGVNGTVIAAPVSLKEAYMKNGGQHGGLDRWFAEKWVDVKTGKACGRSGNDKDGRPYPACRPSRRVSSKTPKTSSEMSSKEKAKFKASKTSSQRIPYNHKRNK